MTSSCHPTATSFGVVFFLLFLVLPGCTGPDTVDTTFTPVGAEDAYEHGVAAHRSGDWVTAERDYRAALELNTRYLAAYLGLGRVLLDDDRPTEALEVFEAAIEIRDRSGEAHWGRAAALLALGRTDESIEEAYLAIDYGYEDEANHILAMAYEETGDIPLAIEMLETLLRTVPTHSAGRIHLGELYVLDDRPSEAVRVLERGARRNEDDLAIWLAFAELLHELQQWDRAIEAWQHVASLTPGDSYANARLGEAYLATGNHMLAMQVFEEATEIEPTRAENYVLRGKAELQAGYVDRARSSAEQALLYAPENLDALSLLAEVCEREGSLESAIDTYQRVLDGNPTSLPTALALAGLLLEDERPDEALVVLAAFEDQAETDPSLTEVLFSAHREAGNANEALEYLVSYVDAHPNDSVLMLEVVETALQLSEQTTLSSSELVETAERALDLSGGFRLEYRIALIDALILDGQRDRAYNEVLAGLEQVPNHPELQERLDELE